MTGCCSQERPHLVCPYDEKPHWVARRAKRGADGLVAWERMPVEEFGEQVLTLAHDLVAAGHVSRELAARRMAQEAFYLGGVV